MLEVITPRVASPLIGAVFGLIIAIGLLVFVADIDP